MSRKVRVSGTHFDLNVAETNSEWIELVSSYMLYRFVFKISFNWLDEARVRTWAAGIDLIRVDYHVDSGR